MSSSDASWLKIWEVVAAIGFIIVIIGVIIEGVEHFKKFPKKEYARKLHIEKIGWLLVVGGLAMEFFGDNAAKRISSREVARLNKEAGEAKKDSAQANEQTSINELKVAQLTHENLLLHSNVVTLERKIEETNKREFADAPQNQPIISLQGRAEILIKNKNALDIIGLNSHGMASLKLGNYRPNENPHHFEIWTGDKIESVNTSPDDPFAVIDVNFNFREVGTAGASEALTLNSLNVMRMQFSPYVNNPTNPIEILGGSIDLTLNSEFKVEFQFPSQISTDFIVTSVKINDPNILPFNSFVPIK